MSRKLPGKPPSQRGTRSHVAHPERVNLNDVRFVAAHEAGHAVAAIVLGFPLKAVDIKRRPLPNGRTSLGFTDTGPIGNPSEIRGDEEAALALIAQSMTGGLAEAKVNPAFFDMGGAMDEDASGARRIAAVALCEWTTTPDGQMSISTAEQKRKEPMIGELIFKASQRADALVCDHWQAISAVAAMLVERKQLTGDEVRAIMESHPPTSA